MILDRVLKKNQVWEEVRLTSRHEQKGMKRRRLRSLRWRQRFSRAVSDTLLFTFYPLGYPLSIYFYGKVRWYSIVLIAIHRWVPRCSLWKWYVEGRHKLEYPHPTLLICVEERNDTWRALIMHDPSMNFITFHSFAQDTNITLEGLRRITAIAYHTVFKCTSYLFNVFL